MQYCKRTGIKMNFSKEKRISYQKSEIKNGNHSQVIFNFECNKSKYGFLVNEKYITNWFVCSKENYFQSKTKFQNNFKDENNSNKALSCMISYSILPIFIIQSTFKR